MRLLRTRTLTNKVDKHMNNANESSKAQEQWQKTVIRTRTMQMRFLSKRTMVNELLSTRTMANDVAKHKNDDR